MYAVSCCCFAKWIKTKIQCEEKTRFSSGKSFVSYKFINVVHLMPNTKIRCTNQMKLFSRDVFIKVTSIPPGRLCVLCFYVLVYLVKGCLCCLCLLSGYVGTCVGWRMNVRKQFSSNFCCCCWVGGCVVSSARSQRCFVRQKKLQRI